MENTAELSWPSIFVSNGRNPLQGGSMTILQKAQSPFILADSIVLTEFCDINVSPEKYSEPEDTTWPVTKRIDQLLKASGSSRKVSAYGLKQAQQDKGGPVDVEPMDMDLVVHRFIIKPNCDGSILAAACLTPRFPSLASNIPDLAHFLLRYGGNRNFDSEICEPEPQDIDDDAPSHPIPVVTGAIGSAAHCMLQKTASFHISNPPWTVCSTSSSSPAKAKRQSYVV
ncbi:hypothetical protein JOM56_015379 [Amanita muscaria]